MYDSDDLHSSLPDPSSYGNIGALDQWVRIQRNTFANWVMEQLDSRGVKVDDLKTDFCDGTKLCALMEVLRDKRIPHVIKRPLNKHQKIDNINLALRVIEEDGIKLVNIGSEDIYAGNLKLILGLIWRLILRYQIGRGRTPAKKLMLAWINAVVRDEHISNFSTDWNDGRALHGVIEYCQPGSCADWKKLSSRNSVQNCQKGMQMAKELFHIPLVLQPENLASPELDELSGMTYLSYFMKINSPGYNATLKWVREQLPQYHVSNFQEDWNDGVLVTELVKSVGGNVIEADASSDAERIQRAFNAGKALGVEPVISAKEMSESDVDHLGVMAYAARLQAYQEKNKPTSARYQSNLSKSHLGSLKENHLNRSFDSMDGSHGTQSPVFTERREEKLEQLKDIKIVLPTNPVYANRKGSFSLKLHPSDSMGKAGALNVTVRGPNSRPVVTRKHEEDRVLCEFIPLETGPHKITVYNPDGSINCSPVILNVQGSASDLRVSSPEPTGKVGRLYPLKNPEFNAPPGIGGTKKYRPPVGDFFLTLSRGFTRRSATVSTAVSPAGSTAGMQKTAGTTSGSTAVSTAGPASKNQVSGKQPLGRNGTVKAQARAPSGGIRSVEVVEQDGIYTVNFTPTESGDWQIGITYDDQHILGSPFTVRVYDPDPEPEPVRVYGIDQMNTMADRAKFSIETSGAGDGQLSVEITYRGRDIPATIEDEGGNRYHISFNPVGGGTYTIRVYYGDQEVVGSPYHMEIIDAGDVEASGEGLVTSEINQRAIFYLNLGPNGSANEVKVQITAPSGASVPSRVVDSRNGNVTVEFVPNEVGEHIIDVYYFGKSIAGNPFQCQVFDWNRISLTNLHGSGIVDQPIEFDIDASTAGAGNLEIMVNDGNIPCSVQNRGNRQFRATFIPRDPIPHHIRMKFNNRDIPGSPWRVDVRNPATVTVSNTDLQFIPVGRIADFEVRTSTIDGEISANVIGPSGRTYRANAINLRNGIHRVEFTPMEVGIHVIELLYDGTLVPGTPITCKAYNTAAIIVSPLHQGYVGMPIEFTIDVTMAGEGQLEIMINRGTVPNTARMISKGLFSVTFVPREARPHDIDISFNGEPLPQGTITVPVVGSNRSMSEMGWYNDGLREVAVNRESTFLLPPQQYPESELTVRVTAPNGELVPAKMIMQPDGDYKVDYSSKYTGRHTVEILHNGLAVMGSPFFVEIYDPNKVRVEGTRTGMVGERMEFDIIRHTAGKAELKLSITGPRGNAVPYDMYTTSTGEHVTYLAKEPGIYQIYITYGGLKVPGCPIKQEIFDNATISVFGEGLTKGLTDKVCTFYVDAKGGTGDVKVQVEGPHSMAKCNIERESSGRYKVTYVPVECGIYRIYVKWNGQDVEGSPFKPKIVDPRRVQVVGGWESHLDSRNHLKLRVNETKTIEFDTRNAGPGQLSVEVRGPDGSSVPVDVLMRDRDRYVVSFVPRLEGEYILKVMWNGAMLDRCPIYGTATRQVINVSHTTTTSSSSTQQNRHQPQQLQAMAPEGEAPPSVPLPPPQQQQQQHHQQETRTTTTTTTTNQQPFSKVIMTGVGLKQAYVGQQAEFYIDGSNAGSGSPNVQLSGTRGDVPVQSYSVGGNKYRCTYTPQYAGTYKLHISWGERQVVGSPYSVSVLQLADPSKVVVAADSLSNQQITMGGEISTTIDTRRAGTGELTAQCMGPTKVAYCQLIDHRDGTFTLLVRPQEPGKHILQVKFAGEHVQGSPFTLRVAGLPDPSKVRVSGPGISDGLISNYQSRFKVETTGAGGGELTVKILGPKGAFRVEMQRQNQRDRVIQCRYDPQEPGEYRIGVKWSGEHVPGSPFNVYIAETPEELNRVRMESRYTSNNSQYGQGPSYSNGLWHDEFD